MDSKFAMYSMDSAQPCVSAVVVRKYAKLVTIRTCTMSQIDVQKYRGRKDQRCFVIPHFSFYCFETPVGA